MLLFILLLSLFLFSAHDIRELCWFQQSTVHYLPERQLSSSFAAERQMASLRVSCDLWPTLLWNIWFNFPQCIVYVFLYVCVCACTCVRLCVCIYMCFSDILPASLITFSQPDRQRRQTAMLFCGLFISYNNNFYICTQILFIYETKGERTACKVGAMFLTKLKIW